MDMQYLNFSGDMYIQFELLEMSVIRIMFNFKSCLNTRLNAACANEATSWFKG